MNNHNVLKTTIMQTPLGDLQLIADEKSLYLAQFTDQSSLHFSIQQIMASSNKQLIPGKNRLINLAEQELENYFHDNHAPFTVPTFLCGTPFQKNVWRQLQAIKHGATNSYKELAQSIGNPAAFRAVANANAANRIAIIIPCHRVINADGNLGGYNGGIERKKWLLTYEQVKTDTLSN